MEKEISIEQETVQNCPILYRMKSRPCTETCMCWGWEFHHGWDRVVQRASYQLEALNNFFYDEYRIRIQADQIKEKYGTLHFYYSVIVDPSKIMTSIKEWLLALNRRLSKINYKMERVKDSDPYDYDEVKEITKEQYKNDLQMRCSNVEHKIQDKKILRITHLKNYGKYHYQPTKHKILHHLSKKIQNLAYNKIFSSKMTATQITISSYIEKTAEGIINQAYEDCMNRCEECGRHIGEDWSKTCTTTGWITYICKDCADKSKNSYFMDGDLYKDGKIIKTRKQIQEEKEQSLVDYHKKLEENKNEIDKKMKELENESTK